MKRRRIALVVVAGVLALLGAGYAMLRLPPVGESGPEADALAHALMDDVHTDLWEQTLALKFTFRGMRSHVWDRARGFEYVRSGKTEVWLDLMDPSAQKGGVVKRGGVVVEGEDARAALGKAWAWFCNDTYWLNPIGKLFDEGTRRSIVLVEGDPPAHALAVTFASGGVTPGDTYVWRKAEGGRARSLAMWVHAAPLTLFPGLEWTWDRWQTLSTGAMVATSHHSRLSTIEITELAGAATLEEIAPDDPFAALVARRAANLAH